MLFDIFDVTTTAVVVIVIAIVVVVVVVDDAADFVLTSAACNTVTDGFLFCFEFFPITLGEPPGGFSTWSCF